MRKCKMCSISKFFPFILIPRLMSCFCWSFLMLASLGPVHEGSAIVFYYHGESRWRLRLCGDARGNISSDSTLKQLRVMNLMRFWYFETFTWQQTHSSSLQELFESFTFLLWCHQNPRDLSLNLSVFPRANWHMYNVFHMWTSTDHLNICPGNVKKVSITVLPVLTKTAQDMQRWWCLLDS